MKVRLARTLAASEIARMCGGTLDAADTDISYVTTDSRETGADTLFVAIKGERFDGHDFITASANGNGLRAALASRIPESLPEGFSLILVDDTVKALGLFAKEYKKLYAPSVVAVTGSVGKTTTKEFIGAVLSEKYKTLKTEGNHNNNIGLPLTLLSIAEGTKVAVIEMGMSGFGEISYLSAIAEPDIGLITNIGTSHIEKLGSREGIAKAKLEIIDGFRPGSKLILNGDEPLLAGRNAIYVGKSESCDFRITNITEGANGTAFDLSAYGETVESIVIPTFGEHNVMNASFAYAVGCALGLGEFEIRRGLMNYKTTGMRQSVNSLCGRTIIEDCYNASPESMLASLKVLSDMAKRENKRSVAVLGDMLELGFYSEEGHRRVGAAAAYEMIGMLVTFGKSAETIARAAVRFGMDPENVYAFDDIGNPEKVGEFLLKNTGVDDIIMFKASRGIRLERVIEYLRAGNR